MPEIKDYSPQVDAQGAVGGVTPNLEAVSLFGRGMEHVGGALEQVGDVLHRRQAQQEISQVYGQFAQARADWNIKIKQRMKDGSIDPDTLDQEYSDYINKAGDGIQTAEGKNFFNRQANRLGGDLLQKAMTGKAQIDGLAAQQEVMDGVNTHVANLMSHPDDATGAIDSTQEYIASEDRLNPVQKSQLTNHLLPQLAEASIKGFAAQDPGQDAQGNDHENIGKQMLDKGAYSEYLNEPQRAALYQYAKQQDNQRRAESLREDTKAHREQQKRGYDRIDALMGDVINGKISIKQIATEDMTGQQKAYMVGEIERMNNAESRTDKPQMNRFYNDIIHGNITTRQQLYDARDAAEKAGHPIAPQQMPFLERQIDNTLDGDAVKHIQKQIYKQIDRGASALKGVGGMPFPGALAIAADTKADLDQNEQLATSQGISRRAFWSNTNTKDPMSPYAIMQKHQISLPDMLNMQAQQLTGAATGRPDPNVTRISNSPTKEVPPLDQQQAPAPANMPDSETIRPNESIMDFKKRRAKAAQSVSPAAPAVDNNPPPAATPAENKTVTQLQDERAAREDVKGSAERKAAKDKEAAIAASIESQKKARDERKRKIEAESKGFNNE